MSEGWIEGLTFDIELGTDVCIAMMLEVVEGNRRRYREYVAEQLRRWLVIGSEYEQSFSTVTSDTSAVTLTNTRRNPIVVTGRQWAMGSR